MKPVGLIILLLCTLAFGEVYQYVYASYSYSTLGGVKTLTVDLRNNGNKNALCQVEFGNQDRSTSVPAYGESQVSFQVYTDAQPRYSCEAN